MKQGIRRCYLKIYGRSEKTKQQDNILCEMEEWLCR